MGPETDDDASHLIQRLLFSRNMLFFNLL